MAAIELSWFLFCKQASHRVRSPEKITPSHLCAHSPPHAYHTPFLSLFDQLIPIAGIGVPVRLRYFLFRQFAMEGCDAKGPSLRSYSFGKPRS
jgi:hypothetical protein